MTKNLTVEQLCLARYKLAHTSGSIVALQRHTTKPRQDVSTVMSCNNRHAAHAKRLMHAAGGINANTVSAKL